MTTEEIMRANNPRTLGEWAFQGFPGRRRREERARSLANEGMQQRVAEERSLADIKQGRAMEFLKEQARIAEEQARYENALRIQAGQILGREGVQNALAQAQGMVPIGENAAIGQEMLKYGAADQMELIRRKQEENAMRQEAHKSGLDLQASQAFENLGRGIGYMTPRPAEAQRPIALQQGSVYVDPVTGMPKFGVGTDDMGNPRVIPFGAPDAPPEARMPAGGAPAVGAPAAPAQKPGLLQRVFGGGAPAAPAAPAQPLLPGATGETSQVRTGPNVSKDAAFQTSSTVSPLGLAGQQVASGIGSFLGRSTFRGGPAGGSPSAGPTEAEQISLYKQSQQPYQPSRSRQLLKLMFKGNANAPTDYDERQRQAAELRRARAFQTLQSLYQ